MSSAIQRVSGILFLLLLAASLPAFEGLEAYGSTVWTGNSRSDRSAPSPVHPALSLAFPFSLADGAVELLPMLSLYRSWYLYDQELSRALPAELEQRESTFLVCLLENSFRFPFIGNDTRKSGPVLSFAFRLPVPLVDWEGDSLSRITEYLYGDGRFFLPAVGWYGEFLLNRKHPLLLDLRCYLPVHRLWDGEGAPFYDRMSLAFRIGYRWSAR